MVTVEIIQQRRKRDAGNLAGPYDFCIVDFRAVVYPLGKRVVPRRIMHDDQLLSGFFQKLVRNSRPFRDLHFLIPPWLEGSQNDGRNHEGTRESDAQTTIPDFPRAYV